MASYAARRVLLLVPLLLAVYTLTFVLFAFTPGDPCKKDKQTPQEYENCLQAKHLKDPLLARYSAYLVNMATRFDLGPSYTQPSRTVNDIIGQFFPFSIILGATAMALAVLVGLPLGIVSALRHNGWADFGSMFLAVVGVSVPAFVV